MEGAQALKADPLPPSGPEAVDHERSCIHCGLPNPLEGDFCCPGCEAAHQVITGMGLGEFYQRRTSTLVRPKEAPTKDPFATPEAEARFVRPTADGAKCVEFFLEGVTCSACAWLVERVPTADSRILRADLDMDRSSVRVVYHPDAALAQVAGVFRNLGFRTRPGDDPALARMRRADRRLWVLRTGVALACMMASMHVAVSLYAGLLEGIAPQIVREMGFALAVVVAPVVFWSAIPFHQGAWQSIRTRRLSLDLLVSLSILAGYAASLRNAWMGINETYFDAVAMLASFLLAGRLITRLAEERVQAGGEFLARELAGEASPARPGDVLEIASGETFPGDGFVRSGSSSMNAAWLTGEEEPVAIGEGDRIWAGAVNLQSAVRVEIEAVGRDTRMGRILSLLSGVGKGPLQKLSRKVEAAIVGMVLLVVLGVVAWGLRQGSLDAGKIVATLLVACPCAVGLAVPAVLGVAHRQAAGRRILLKGVDAFERVAEADIVVFDKTGTLTRPIPVLRDERWGIPEGERPAWEAVLGALSRSSVHLALRPLRDRFPATDPLRNVAEHVGCGLETEIDGRTIRLGRRDWVLEGSTASTELEMTEIVLGADGREIAGFSLESKLRSEAPEVVERLARGREAWILSGDKAGPVRAVATRCGIPAARALSSQSPEDKLRVVRELAARGKVLFVGDGINDAAALKAAQIGVGVQGGAAAALTSCDVYLARDDLRLLVHLVEASRKVRGHIWMALVWSALWNALGVGLVLSGHLGPVVCAILMPLSSVLVVGYALTRRPFPKGTP